MRSRTNNRRRSTDFGLTLFMGRRVASQRRSEPEKAKILRSKGAVTLLLAGAVALAIASEGAAAKSTAEVNGQRGRAYSAGGEASAQARIPATSAAPGAVWVVRS